HLGGRTAIGKDGGLHQVYFEAPSCLPATPPERVFLVGDHSSAAQFYVTVAVSAFLYSPISLAAYICRPAHFRPGNPAPRIDLLVTSLLAFLWLVSSCAWAVALGDVKAATDPGSVLTQIGACRSGGAGRCRPISSAHMAGLNTSVVSHWLVSLLVPPTLCCDWLVGFVVPPPSRVIDVPISPLYLPI
uniref:Synaptophysin n=1 Tax=Coturnix japonica TaxID=93934 RepID=A0A8C2ST00_COTJA